MQTWVQVSQIVVNTAQVVGIVVGGVWVYFKFIRSRTFARRAELDVQGEIARVDNHQLVRVEVELKNVGLTKLTLKPRHQVAFLQGAKAADWSPNANLKWEELILQEIFKDQKFVEGQETIQDEVLLPVNEAGGPWLAFRVQVLVVGQRPRFRTQDSAWVTYVVVPATKQQQHGAGDHGMGGGG